MRALADGPCVGNLSATIRGVAIFVVALFNPPSNSLANLDYFGKLDLLSEVANVVNVVNKAPNTILDAYCFAVVGLAIPNPRYFRFR